MFHVFDVQVETGSAITWKYPSVVLKGDNSVGEFYSVALTNHKQQADTGTKMVHVGKNTRSRIVSKGISAGNSVNAYRGLVQVQPTARGARNYSQCDSMLIGDQAGANTYPYIQVCIAAAVAWHSSSCMDAHVCSICWQCGGCSGLHVRHPVPVLATLVKGQRMAVSQHILWPSMHACSLVLPIGA